MTAQLSREELQTIADTDHVQCGDAAAMARMLLAVMDSEPVAVPDCFRNAVSALESLYRNGQKQCWNERYTTDMSYASGVLNACRAAMLKAGPVTAATVPDGWKLVPVDPTWEMLSADGCKEHDDGQKCLHHDNRRRIWRAMLAAAPAAPEQE